MCLVIIVSQILFFVVEIDLPINDVMFLQGIIMQSYNGIISLWRV